jgi:hypothetical protein
LNVLSVNCSIATTASALASSPVRSPTHAVRDEKQVSARFTPNCAFASGRLVGQMRIVLVSSALRN